jgi:hypothetical protein
MLAWTQFVMGKTEVVHAPDEIHAAFQRLQSLSGMSTCACERSSPLTHRAIEPLNKGRIVYRAS